MGRSRDARKWAQRLRANPTPAEALLLSRLGEEDGWIFQHLVYVTGWEDWVRKPFILDFYHPGSRLAVEVDGRYHCDPAQREKDERRTALLESNYKIRVLRYTNEQVLRDPDHVVASVGAAIAGRPAPPVPRRPKPRKRPNLSARRKAHEVRDSRVVTFDGRTPCVAVSRPTRTAKERKKDLRAAEARWDARTRQLMAQAKASQQSRSHSSG